MVCDVGVALELLLFYFDRMCITSTVEFKHRVQCSAFHWNLFVVGGEGSLVQSTYLVTVMCLPVSLRTRCAITGCSSASSVAASGAEIILTWTQRFATFVCLMDSSVTDTNAKCEYKQSHALRSCTIPITDACIS